MSKICKLIVCVFVFSTFLVGCNDMLDVNSERLTSEKEYGLNAPGDSIYSMFGIFSRLQKLGDSYVLLGELRGDLMDITETSDPYLREINNFNISSQNIYVNIKDYYDLINNCNYVIQKLDTAVVDKGLKLKLREYAAVKAIRDWTYMQMALNFKTVKYYDKPILSVTDAEKDYTANEYNFQQLADILIADLEPLKEVATPDLGEIDSYNSAFSFFPVRFVLGDLYLWRASMTNSAADYQNAATEYHQLMYEDYLCIYKNYTSYYVSVNNTITNSAYLSWINSFALSSGEVITTILCPTEYGQNFYLDSLNSQSKIAPSAIALNNWNKQTYYLNEASNTQGDLRMYGSIWYKEITTNPTSNSSYTGDKGTKTYIYKYKVNKNNVIVYRSSLLYLRYAEAVNRLNKPKLAFAVLKYGLNSVNLGKEKIFPASERGSSTSLPTYMNFNDFRFNNNVGIRMRGQGNMDKDTSFYALPKLKSMTDSVLYVEDLVQQELALETAFEGNRFHDLMRFAIRRNDYAYLADKVAAKHPENYDAIHSILMIPDNWYINYKK